eukprot:TRINITY_DN4179_c0_g1_i1.p1 TRINITY_DN4179_c0_g1~~TRINITY_DN4179_c0_g1_i1.p1  ORF type:complete len:114 (-),score=16.35 TRINITY_DN4179_c0_g1_i1:311-652(-)
MRQVLKDQYMKVTTRLQSVIDERNSSVVNGCARLLGALATILDEQEVGSFFQWAISGLKASHAPKSHQIFYLLGLQECLSLGDREKHATHASSLSKECIEVFESITDQKILLI